MSEPEHYEVADAVKQGRFEDALRICKSWILRQCRSNHGMILTRIGQTAEAKLVLDEAILLDKYSREAYWFRHQLHNKLGNVAQSQSDKKIAEGYGYKPYI